MKGKIALIVSIVHKSLLVIALMLSVNSFANVKGEKDASKKKEVQCKSANANDTINYGFNIQNTHNSKQTFHLQIHKPREIASISFLKDTLITLEPGCIYKANLSVIISDRIPIGGQESCFVTVKTDNSLEKFEFISVRSMPHPFVLVTNDVIAEAKEKINNYSWAKENLNLMLKQLDKFEFPKRKIVTKPRPVKVWSSLAYDRSDGEKAFKMCLAWRLTGNEIYKKKVVEFLREVCDKEEGYLSIGAATTGVQVHEGNFFMFLAAACDILYAEDDLTSSDKENIEATFRYYLELNRKHMDGLGIMNHQASANAGAILAALFLQDMSEVEYLTNADGGMGDQIAKGVMADGWWFEGTANYCYLVAQRYVLVAQAFENHGLDLYHRRFPTEFKSKDFENAKEGYTGMKFDNWGPTGKNTRGVEDMVSPYICMMDEDANVVASNDTNLKEPNEFYELAYREYGSKELAWVLSKSKRDSWVSLMYGIPEIPVVEDPRTASDFVANVGLVALRSQGKSHVPEEQIQAYFKYGTHGGWHGHFDRTGMVALDRYGHKFFSTEMVWFGYGKPGYKECVQTSATHNMVVVDELQQEAVPSEQLLFYKGDMMQVSVTETNARWRTIPTWNAEKFPPWDDKEFDEAFKPVQQRRVSIVTDDYVVIADYINAPQKHTYDWLLHPKGFKSINGVRKTGGVLDSLSKKYDSPYKYFKKGQWYKTKKGAEIKFLDEGVNLDVHTLWPKKADVLLANYPIGGKPRGMKNNPDRKTYGVRVNAKTAQFLNVLEPYKGKSQIFKIVSANPNELIVKLIDGREQKISISNIESSNIKIEIVEKKDKDIIRTEKTN
ncbi:heparinase II/III family protein [Seonamhaeicola sp. MEBiC1930]|uniref:alginate lyase family protein n=1 Tax=Seonamhaeicola sp. MEBiC01930 TaxID=2976768 RepID=UPI00325052F5